eukprot:9783547-Karenia_brevis.AAC.1
MLYGLSPPLTLMPNSPWWTNTLDDIDVDPFCQWLLPYSNYDAKTAFQILNNIQQRLDPPPHPAFVETEAPEQPNIYSDGAFTHPTTPWYGLASA